MAIKLSTGLRNTLRDGDSLAGALDSGFIHIYAGTGPSTADAAITDQTLLCTISVGSSGDGLSFDDAVGGVISKNTGEVWSGVNQGSGVASFYRHVGSEDTEAASSTEPRIQGTVALAGGDMNLTNTSLSSGATQTIDYYTIALPTY